jgi:hypothetical protein
VIAGNPCCGLFLPIALAPLPERLVGGHQQQPLAPSDLAVVDLLLTEGIEEVAGAPVFRLPSEGWRLEPLFQLTPLSSDPGALPPEPGVSAAMQHRQHDDVTLSWNRPVDDDVGDAVENQPHLSQELTPQASFLGFVPASRSVEIISGCWTKPQHHTHSDRSIASSAASASRPGSPSARKLSSR